MDGNVLWVPKVTGTRIPESHLQQFVFFYSRNNEDKWWFLANDDWLCPVFPGTKRRDVTYVILYINGLSLVQVTWMVAGHSLTRMVNHAAVKEERTSFVIERAFMHTILICTGIAKRTQGLNLCYYHQFSLPHHCQHTSGQKSVIDNDDYGEYTSSRGFSMICGTFTLSWSSLTHIGYVVERAFPSRFVDFSLQ